LMGGGCATWVRVSTHSWNFGPFLSDIYVATRVPRVQRRISSLQFAPV
jgi:hypothetical protein